MPRSLPQFKAYLRACEVPEIDWPVWESAWTRAWRLEKQEDDGAFAIPFEARAPRVSVSGGDHAKVVLTFPVRDVDFLEHLVSTGRMRRSGSRRVRRGELRRALNLLSTLETLVAQTTLADRGVGGQRPYLMPPEVRFGSPRAG